MIRDGDWTLFDSDYLGKRQVWRRKNSDGSVTYRTDYKVDDVLDQNAAIRSETAGERFGDWRMVASVPLTTHFNELQAAQSQMDSRYIDKWLAENSKFKTFR